MKICWTTEFVGLIRHLYVPVRKSPVRRCKRSNLIGENDFGKMTLRDISELFERNETGRVGSADTGPTMLDWLVGDRELAQIMTNHLGFDFNLVECFALVDSDDASDHLGHDDHVSQVRLHGLGLLVGKTSLLRLTQLLDETHRLALETTSQLAANAAREQLHQLVGRHVQQLVKVDSSVSVFPEGSLFGLNIRHFTCLLRLRLEKYKIWRCFSFVPDAISLKDRRSRN